MTQSPNKPVRLFITISSVLARLENQGISKERHGIMNVDAFMKTLIRFKLVVNQHSISFD